MQSLYRATRSLPLLFSRYRHSASTDPFRKVQQPPDWVGRAQPTISSRDIIPLVMGMSLGRKGRYQVISNLGWGAYLTVWLARYTFSSDDTAVALKIMQGEGPLNLTLPPAY